MKGNFSWRKIIPLEFVRVPLSLSTYFVVLGIIDKYKENKDNNVHEKRSNKVTTPTIFKEK